MTNVAIDDDLDALCLRVEELETAIRKHRDVRGHDRCWLDDLELYQALGEPVNQEEFVLPPKKEFLAQCCQYWLNRQPLPSTDEIIHRLRELVLTRIHQGDPVEGALLQAMDVLKRVGMRSW